MDKSEYCQRFPESELEKKGLRPRKESLTKKSLGARISGIMKEEK